MTDIWTPNAADAPLTLTRAEVEARLRQQTHQLQQAYAVIVALVTADGPIPRSTPGDGQIVAAIPARALEAIAPGTNVRLEPALDRSAMHVMVSPPRTDLSSGAFGLVGQPLRMIHKKRDGTVDVH